MDDFNIFCLHFRLWCLMAFTVIYSEILAWYDQYPITPWYDAQYFENPCLRKESCARSIDSTFCCYELYLPQ